MALISVSANDIDRAGVSIDAELPVPWLERELTDADARAQLPGRIRARLSRSGVAEIVVRGRITAKISVPCARCLDPAPIDVDAELSLLLEPDPSPGKAGQKKAKDTERKQDGGGKQKRSSARAPEYEFSSAEADIDSYDGETVELDEFIREAILLELPSFPLCSEACPGIPQPPGASGQPSDAVAPRSGIDPRLAPLEQLQKRLARAGGAGPRSDGPSSRSKTTTRARSGRSAPPKRTKPGTASAKPAKTPAKRKSR